MRYLLNTLYLVTIFLLSPWLIYKGLTTGKYRRGLWAKLSGRAFVRQGERPCAWFHGVSVGEIHLLRPVVAAFREAHPEWECVISTTTDTGHDEARKRFADLPVFFWPLDFTWAVRRALGKVRPNLVVLAEGEVWPNFIAAAKRQGAKVAIINGRMSPRSFRRYHALRWLTGGVFRKLDLVAAQTEEYAAHYRALGVAPERIDVTGNVKYDGVTTDRDNPRTRELGALLDLGGLVLIGGSTQAPEEHILLNIYRRARQQHPGLHLILVPRQKDRFDEVANLLVRSGESFIRRTTLSASHPLTPSSPHPIILIDTIGELGAIWGLADVAFVGGSLDGQRGGQNMIEPAAYGAAVLFGPHTWNFKDTVARLLEHRAAIQVADAAEMELEILRLLADASARTELGAAAQRFVLSQQGATERTIRALLQLMVMANRHTRAA